MIYLQLKYCLSVIKIKFLNQHIYIISKMRHIIIQEEGFSTSLQNSFTIISNQGKSLAIQSDIETVKPYDSLICGQSINIKQILNNTTEKFPKSNARSLYTFSDLLLNDHSEDYVPLSKSFKQTNFQLSILNEKDQSSLMIERSDKIDGQAFDKQRLKADRDLRKIGNQQLKQKNLRKIYYMGSFEVQISYSLAIVKGQDKTIRNTLWEKKAGDNILKFPCSEKTKPFTQEMSQSINQYNKIKKMKKTLEVFMQKNRKQEMYEAPLQLKIYSNFQSGNLAEVYQSLTLNNTYFLFLKNDTNTNGYTQWFNFCIQCRDQSSFHYHRFIIMNLSKKILYAPGMKILSKNHNKIKYIQINRKQTSPNYQTKLKFEVTQKPQTWRRQIQFLYYQSKQNKYDGSPYMIMDFIVSSQSLVRGMNFALSFPYTYSRLNKLIEDIQLSVTSHKIEKQKLNVVKAGESSLGLNIYAIQINTGQISTKQHNNQIKNETSKKKIKIVVLARQHPSETVGSFVCEYIIKKLISNFFDQNNQSYQKMNTFSNYEWYIIPMVNPDGVIHGNSRTNIKGYDVNRCWNKDIINIQTQAQSITKFIQTLELNSTDFVIDLHGHSRDFGVFTFSSEGNSTVNLFNLNMSQLCPFFCYRKCTYKIENSKKDTLRAQIYQRYRIKNCITIETSMYGFQLIQKDTKKVIPFQEQDFNLIAQSILKSLDYIAFQSIKNQKQRDQVKKIETTDNYEDISIVKGEDIKSSSKILIIDENDDSRDNDDSDSNPEGEYLLDLQRRQLQVDENLKEQDRKLIKSPQEKRIHKNSNSNSSLNLNLKKQNQKTKIKKQVKLTGKQQKLNYINFTEVTPKIEEVKKKTPSFIQNYSSFKLEKAFKKSANFKSQREIRNQIQEQKEQNVSASQPKKQTYCDNYYDRKTFRNLYNVTSENFKKDLKDRNKSNNSLEFKSKHFSIQCKKMNQTLDNKKEVIQIKNFTLKDPKKITLKDSLPQKQDYTIVAQNQFLQSSTTINWKLKRMQQQTQIKRIKTQSSEQKQKYQNNFDVKQIANLQKKTKLLRNLQKVKNLSNSVNSKSFIESKLKSFRLNNSKINSHNFSSSNF